MEDLPLPIDRGEVVGGSLPHPTPDSELFFKVCNPNRPMAAALRDLESRQPMPRRARANLLAGRSLARGLRACSLAC